jgi:hypothetical protein
VPACPVLKKMPTPMSMLQYWYCTVNVQSGKSGRIDRNRVEEDLHWERRVVPLVQEGDGQLDKLQSCTYISIH